MLLVCGVLCAAPEFGRQSDEAQRLADDIANLSPQDRQRAAEKIVNDAHAAQPGEREQLQGLARLVELPQDPKELAKAIAELKKRGTDFKNLLSQEILVKLAAMEKSKNEGGLAIGTGDPGIKVTPLEQLPGKTGPVVVQVYDPEIGDVLATRPAASNGGDGHTAAIGEPVSSDQAWRIASERAAASLESGRIPPQYRDIMRNFFEPSPKN
jgi:hypothetical protein